MKSTTTRPPARRPATTPAQRAANAARTQDFVRGVIAEMRRVTWPTREEWIAATALTIALVVGVGVFTYGCDMLFAWLFTLLTAGQR
ncbi:MAG TPA: preprotein translocase subunit SecE [Candidatus Elarobacter sp.]|jgi:preprotein translocase SecE subunit|nr:preprotein translocase subunit SecE [Candidatus Elarobacter sp.]